MVSTRFGTDGVRGVANVELTPELVLALGRAVARTITATTFLIGRDTRRSGPLLQAALSAGLASEGADVVDVGVLPTPALAWLSAARNVPAVVISASHNPFADNGIKLFAAGGAKLGDEVEAAIEDELERILDPSVKGPRTLEGHGVGRLTAEPGIGEAYVDHLGSLLEGRPLDGLRVVVDSANGAASALAARRLRAAGGGGGGHRLRARRHQHQRRVRFDLHRHAGRRRGRAPGRPRPGPRRRRRPAAGGRPPTARWSTATSCSPCSPSTWPSGASWPATRWWSRS